MPSEVGEKLDSIVRVMREYQAAVDGINREKARLLGVNSTDLRCLEILTAEPHTQFTPRIIADHMNMTTGSVTILLDRLARAGYITRAPHGIDRRKVVVTVTPEVGQHSQTIANPMLEDSLTNMSTHFTAEELSIVERFLTKATRLQEKHAHRLGEASPTSLNQATPDMK